MTKDEMEKYFFSQKSIEEIVDTATIVVDTNVLLSAYQWKEAAFREVLEVLMQASKAGRLKIPFHVLEEFMDQRPKLITAAIDRINTDIYSKIQKPNKLSSTLPLIGLLSDHSEYTESEEKYINSYKEYRNKLDELSSKLKSFFQKDPVLDSLRSIFEDSCFTFIDKNDSTVLKEAADRMAKRKPPLTGGDSGKKENKFGDYFIWKDILSLNNDVIFVSTDFKEDWYHLDSKKKPIAPRRELVEEFYELSSGKTCCIISLADFIQASAPSASEEIIINLLENQTLNTFENTQSQQFNQNFMLTIIPKEPKAFEKLAYDVYSFLYYNYDIKVFSHSGIYIDPHANKKEYIYIKFKMVDGRISSSDILNGLSKWSGSGGHSYKLLEVEEISDSNDESIQFTNLNGNYDSLI